MKKVIVKTKFRKEYIITALIVSMIIGAFIILHKLDSDFMETCQNQGYSYDYCLANK